jgi:hypothetical protein
MSGAPGIPESFKREVVDRVVARGLPAIAAQHLKGSAVRSAWPIDNISGGRRTSRELMARSGNWRPRDGA